MSSTCESNFTASPPGVTLLETLLADQQELTAVDRFAQLHERDQLPVHGRRYRDLIPTQQPGPGQQFAFEVDMDACSGCKSCVTACHNLNGLEDSENWRRVGLLVGGGDSLPVLQHITSSCHHCLEPACMHGCPVEAYEKDQHTGIVRHLDDQCIGCQYCTFLCPYDVPQYSPDKGIVRKCDMCHERLSAGEAPACVQSCPNHAIRIVTVVEQEVTQDCQMGEVVPGTPDASLTFPATVYRSRTPLPRNMSSTELPASEPQHAHWPLVVMLVMTQVAVGALLMQQLFQPVLTFFGAPAELAGEYEILLTRLQPWPQIAPLLLGLTGMAASILHLGRPQFAFRALIGLRHSWLSREILGFTLFGLFAGLFTFASLAAPSGDSGNTIVFGALAASAGTAAVGCSIMVYSVTAIPLWKLSMTSSRFLLTMFLMGLPSTFLILVTSAATSSQLTIDEVMSDYSGPVCRGILLLAVAKMGVELSLLRHLFGRRDSALRQSARLMIGPLSMKLVLRLVLLAVGGLLLPLIMLHEQAITAGEGFHPLFVSLWAFLSWTALCAGELLERTLYFMAAASPRMPGTR